MKRTASLADSPLRTRRLILALTLSLSASLTLQSCIYDAPGDNLYRTLWVSSEEGASVTDRRISGDDQTSGDKLTSGDSRTTGSGYRPNLTGLTLEFLCGGSVSIRAKGAAGSFGTYSANKSSATFKGLTLTYYTGSAPTVLIIEEAHRNNNILVINWHYADCDESHTTDLLRRSSY